jgi:hypothetical protein
MLSLLCSTASIGVADELAVADAEAGLEERVNLAHWQPSSRALTISGASAA